MNPLRPVRFILNTAYSGPQAWFFLADDRGYFRDAGLAVAFTPGDTMANAVPRLMDGPFDAGYGDMNALIEAAAARPDDAPMAVFALHNRSPYTIAVAADGPIRTPADLAGRHLVTHPNDAAWRMFPEFCAATGLDPASVQIDESSLPHREIVPRLLKGEWDGLFGFVNTVRSRTLEAGIDPDTALRHFEWQHHVPSLYGGALMVTPTLLREAPETVQGLVTAVNRGLHDAANDIEAAIDAVARRDPSIDRAANRARLEGTLAGEMAHPERARIGIGAVDAARLSATIELMARAKSFAVVPTVDRIFSDRFLPPLAQRFTSRVG